MSERIKPRQREILKYLMSSGVPRDVKFFEDRFQRSERTIRYDLNELKDFCASHGVEICYQTKQGYYIPASQKMQCSQILLYDNQLRETEFFIGTEEERYKALFLFFLVQKKNLTADQIAEQFYISRSTLVRMLPKLTQYFDEQFQIKARKGGGYELIGDEATLRKIAVGIIAQQFKGSYTAEDWYLLLPNALKCCVNLQHMIAISNSIKKINAIYNIWVSNTGFLNLISYCIVQDIRMKNKPLGKRGTLSLNYAGYAFQLLLELSNTEQGIEEKELEYLQKFLAEHGITAGNQEVDEDYLQEVLLEMLEFLKKEPVIQEREFDSDSFFKDVHDHLKNFLSLLVAGTEYKEENYLVIQEVKENYYEFYKIALKCIALLEQRMGSSFSDTEVCYIGIYLYKNCKEKSIHRKKVLVVCATGKGLSHLLTLRVASVFPMLEIIGQASPYQLSNPGSYSGADFLISTIPLTEISIPVVKISRILSGEDIKRIQGFLEYGELMDEIPLKQKDKFSFSSKEDPFALSENTERISREHLTYATNLLSKLILTMLEYTSKFPLKYKLSQDVLLSLIIHMSMAVPRWYQGRQPDENHEECEAEYEKIRRNHQEVFEIMGKFFELVEKSLMVSIPTEEKMAFFLYIIKEGE